MKNPPLSKFPLYYEKLAGDAKVRRIIRRRPPSITKRLLLIFFSYYLLLAPLLVPSTSTVYADPIIASPKAVESLKDFKPLPATKLADQTVLELLWAARASIGAGTYQACQCTAGVASWTFVLPNMGNANQWDDRARAAGARVSTVPAVGAVAQTDRGQWGHVGLIVRMEGATPIMREMNWNGPCSVREAPLTNLSGWEFIYF